MPNQPNPPKKTEQEVADAAAAAALAGGATPKDTNIEATAPAATFIKNLIGAVPPKKPEDKTKEPADDKGDLKKPDPKAKKKDVAPPQSIDEVKLGESIGKSIAEHTAKAANKKADEARADAPKADPKEARRIAVLERMEKIDPRYNGLAVRYQENKTKLREYAAKWEEANPGEKFDENADEHSDFIEALEAQIAYDDDDYTDALTDIKADQKLAGQKSELDERVANVERAEKVREEAPRIQSAGIAAGNEFWKDMGDDYKDVLDDKGNLNAETLKTMAEADPVKHEIVIAAADSSERVAQTLYMLSNGLAKYDPKNPLHEQLGQFALKQEAVMQGRPTEDQRDDKGRRFAPKAAYDRMAKEDRDRHWTFSADDLAYMAAKDIARQAKAHLKAEDEKFSRRARARGLIVEDEKPEPKAVPGATRRLREPDPNTDEDEPANGGKPLSPSVSSSPKLAAGRAVKLDEGKSGAARFVSKLIG